MNASRPRRASALLGALALSGALSARSAEDLSTWGHFRDVYYDTSPGGADVAATVGNFPVLVRVRAPGFDFSQAMGKGQDLRLAKPNGVPLSFEIERWDSAGGKADLWVRIDTLPGNSQGTLARMYWGKPGSVSASDGNAVFNPSIGFDYVWHLGGAGTGPRPNSLASKPAATPFKYAGDESKEGAAGLCDSLDGKSGGDYLDVGDGYSEFASATTISLWAYPTRAAVWSRFLDFGNGAGADNIMLARRDNSQDLVFNLWNSSGQFLAGMTAPGAIALDQWQFFAVTVSGKSASIYRNGALVASADLAAPISNVRRTSAFLGRSNWVADEYYAGKLDEVELSHVAHSPNWFKLAYANQRPDQKLIRFAPPSSQCVAKFAAPSDTSLPEGSSLELAGLADCATAYAWSVVSGPALRILDPEVKALQVALPRVTRDTAIVYRFSATFVGASQSRDVRVGVRDAIPDPVFALKDAAWNGKDSLLMSPVIENLAEVQASSEPRLYYAWTLAGIADTVWRRDGLLLRSPQGDLTVGLCLHNNGAPLCDTARVTVSQAVGLAPRAPADRAGAKPLRDARGRKLFYLNSIPAFPSPAR